MSFKNHIEEEYGVLLESKRPSSRAPEREAQVPGVSMTGYFVDAGTIGEYGKPYYGETATREARPFQSIVVHHTAGTKSAAQYAKGAHAWDSRGSSYGYFGYHFIVQGGNVIQSAPMAARTNHAKAERLGGKSSVFNSRSSIGVSFVGVAGHYPQGEEYETGLKLIAGLMKRYRIDTKNISSHDRTDGRGGEGNWIFDAIQNGDLARYLGKSKVSPGMFNAIASDVVSGTMNTPSGALTGLAIAGILLGGAYAFKRFLGRSAEYKEAERILQDRETKLNLMRIRMQHEELIERAKTDPRAADLLKRVLTDAVSGRDKQAFYRY